MKLRDLIQEGLDQVKKSQHHDLDLVFRHRLFALFDADGEPVGRRRRTSLATLAIRKVLPIWQKKFPFDKSPERALVSAEQVIQGVFNEDEVTADISDLWTHCEDLLENVDDDGLNVLMVGFGAVQALKEAISERQFGSEFVNDGSTGYDIDAYTDDSYYYAAIAYSEGNALEGTGDAQKRLEFWTWWLTIAVPAAYGEYI